MIVIVSGLPRSGTSMMMQMLEEGGYPVLADDARQADAWNPDGYRESALVKSLPRDSSWLDSAEGKAVKVVSPLLTYLPSRHRYRIIFMARDLHEVLASQNALLAGLGKAPGMPKSEQSWKERMQRHLQDVDQWLSCSTFVTCLRLEYRQVLADPVRTAECIARFTERELDINRMVAAVHPGLAHHHVPPAGREEDDFL